MTDPNPQLRKAIEFLQQLADGRTEARHALRNLDRAIEQIAGYNKYLYGRVTDSQIPHTDDNAETAKSPKEPAGDEPAILDRGLGGVDLSEPDGWRDDDEAAEWIRAAKSDGPSAGEADEQITREVPITWAQVRVLRRALVAEYEGGGTETRLAHCLGAIIRSWEGS